ncbi:MAG: hypothetical protein ABSG15_03400 [FCB group bacterium]
MKIIAPTLALTAIFILICSCNDISDLPGNINISSNQTSSLTKDDSIGFLDLPTIDFGNIHLHRVAYLYVTFKNTSDNYTIKIYNVKIKNNYGFELYPELGFPVIIPPNQSNESNRFIAKWDTNVIKVGSFQDTIFLNNSEKYPVNILGTVYDK